MQSSSSSCCAAVENEKSVRSKLRSETDRHLGSATCVVLDTLNNIKGYRYELWCMARAASTKCCVLWVQTSSHICRLWHQARAPNQVRCREYVQAIRH
jgi:protein KTI12